MSSESGRVILIPILINAVLAIDLDSIHTRSKLLTVNLFIFDEIKVASSLTNMVKKNFL